MWRTLWACLTMSSIVFRKTSTFASLFGQVGHVVRLFPERRCIMSLILLTPDATRVKWNGTELRQCPLDATRGKILYCSREGKFYSRKQVCDGATEMRELKHQYSPGMQNHKGGSAYPIMHYYGNRTCHMLMALTWLGPRPDGHEIDHINGDILNWSADNLQYVTPAENRKRAKLLRVLRSIGRDPKQMSREELLNIFEKYEFTNN